MCIYDEIKDILGIDLGDELEIWEPVYCKHGSLIGMRFLHVYLSGIFDKDGLYLQLEVLDSEGLDPLQCGSTISRPLSWLGTINYEECNVNLDDLYDLLTA